MRIGILGSGLMGGKLGTIFARAGHEVVFSYSHSKAKLEKLAREAGGRASAGTPAEAAKDADALLLAVHWSRVDDVLKKAGDVSGKVIVTCSLPMNAASPVIGPWKPIFGLSQPAFAADDAAGLTSARANAEATTASDATMSTARAAAPFRFLPCIPCPPVDCTVLRRRNQF